MAEPVPGAGLGTGSAGDIESIDADVLRSTGGTDFGVTAAGFVPKPFARLLTEKLALARAVLGDDVDLTASSVLRKLLEITALEDARTWAALASMYDNSFVATAVGEALSTLGTELGLERPYLEATGTVTLTLTGTLPPGVTSLVLPAGARLLSPRGHDAATLSTVSLSPADPSREVGVTAFRPGPEGDLDPGVTDGAVHPQRLESWNPLDPKLAAFLALRAQSGGTLDVQISHAQPLTGGELRWPDQRYRALLLRAPRSLWTADVLQMAASLVPGVRQARVLDVWGGIDVNQSIFGNFSFLERLFSADRDVVSPYFVTVLVAATDAAIWDGPTGVRQEVLAAIEDLRPLGIFPAVERGEPVNVSLEADLVVRDIPLPAGSIDAVNNSPAAVTLKTRLSERVRSYVTGLSFGEPVRAAEVTRALMSEPGIRDVQGLVLLRWPTPIDTQLAGSASLTPPAGPVRVGLGDNVVVPPSSIPTYVELLDRMRIVAR
jgi:hypothetical protein